MQPAMKRICIYPKDIAIITGKSYRQSLRIYNQIKTNLEKDKNQEVSITELASYLGISVEEVQKTI